MGRPVSVYTYYASIVCFERCHAWCQGCLLGAPDLIFRGSKTSLPEIAQWYTICPRSRVNKQLTVNLYFHRKAMLTLWPFTFDINHDFNCHHCLNMYMSLWDGVLVLDNIYTYSASY